MEGEAYIKTIHNLHIRANQWTTYNIYIGNKHNVQNFYDIFICMSEIFNTLPLLALHTGVYPPQTTMALFPHSHIFAPPPFLPPTPLPPANNFWTLYTQFCAIYACFQWILEAVSQG